MLINGQFLDYFLNTYFPLLWKKASFLSFFVKDKFLNSNRFHQKRKNQQLYLFGKEIDKDSKITFFITFY